MTLFENFEFLFEKINDTRKDLEDIDTEMEYAMKKLMKKGIEEEIKAVDSSEIGKKIRYISLS